MDAVVTAGSRPFTNEPLYEYSRGGYKAMIEIAGKSMIQWVLDALSAAHCVERVVVVGLPPYTNLFCDRSLTILEDHGGLLENARAGVLELQRQNPQTGKVLLLTSDVPAVTGEMIDWVASTALETDDQFFYPVISRETMEARFPGSKRTYVHLKDVEVCGADVMAAHASLAGAENPKIQQMIDTRKNPLKQASLLGYDTLFMILLRQLSLAEAGASLGKRLGITARAVLSPYAELGMDIDKPNQLALVKEALGRLQSV